MNDTQYSVDLDSCVSGARLASVTACPFDRTQVPQAALGRLSQYTKDDFSQEDLVSIGNALADLLLQGAVRDAFLAILRQFPKAPITLRLKIGHRALAALPWEFLRLEAAAPALLRGRLFQNDRITLRRECGSRTPLPELPLDQVRVLIVWADPGSASFPPLLHLAAEVEALSAVLHQRGVHHITELRRATQENLRKEIQELQPHLLHFIGHGQQRRSGDHLILSGAEPNSETSLPAEELANWLAGTPIRLVTLAACDTLGVGQTLAARGVPAVVAMQAPFADDLAVPFTQNFYMSLLQPCPAATALARTRSALRGSGPAWGVPTLLQSVGSDILFTSPPPVEAPFHVPLSRNPEFVGHRALLEEMHRTLSAPASRSITLFGMGGQGKTQLAAEYAHSFQHAYPGGVFWIKAATTHGIIEELGRIGRLYFALPEDRTPREVALYVQEKLQNVPRPTLLIYDNVSWENEADPNEKTEPELFLPVRGSCRVIVTTRDRLLSPPLARIFDSELTLETADALALLTQARTLRAKELKEAERVLELTGALPLALVLAAHHIQRSMSGFREYREYLEHSRIDTLTRSRRGFLSTTKHNGMIFNAIAISYCAQQPLHRSLLVLLACFNRQSISPDLAWKASEFPNRMAFNDALADLIDCALLRREEDGRLTLHELVRVFVLGEQSQEMLRSTASAIAAPMAEKMRHANDTMQWQEIYLELPHCRAITQMCREHRALTPLIDLLLAHGGYLMEQRKFEDAQDCCLEGIALTEKDPDHCLQLAHFWRIYGEILLAKRKSPADYTDYAAAEKAFEIAANALGLDDPEMWHFYNTKGLLLKTHKRLSEALPCYEAAYRLCSEAFDDGDERIALLLNNIAALQEEREDFRAALKNYRRSLALYVGKYGEGDSKTAIRRNNIGRVLYGLGEFEEACRQHEQAFRIHSATSHEGSLHALMSRYYYALPCYALGRCAEAQAAYDAAMAGLLDVLGSSHPSYLHLKEKWRRLTGGPGAS